MNSTYAGLISAEEVHASDICKLDNSTTDNLNMDYTYMIGWNQSAALEKIMDDCYGKTTCNTTINPGDYYYDGVDIPYDLNTGMTIFFAQVEC